MKSNWSLLSITFIERFAYYLFNSVLILFLISQDNFPQERSLNIYSTFKLLIYSLPAVMGIVSDITDRKKVFRIGIVMSIIGYLLIPISSSNYWALTFSIVILALGITIIKPNIPVLIGDNISKTGNNKRLFRDFITMMLLTSLAPMIANGINGSFSDNILTIVIISCSILMLIVFLIYHFISSHNYNQRVDYNLKPQQFIPLLSAIFVVGFIFTILTNNVSPKLAIETENSTMSYYNISKFFSVLFTIILLAVLAIKSIKIPINNIALLLGLSTIGFALIFLSFDFTGLSKLSLSPDSKLFAIALIAVVETVAHPIITFIIYKFSTKYKGFVFGLYYSLLAWIASSFNKMEFDRYLLIPILLLIALGITIILKRKKIKNICD